MHSPRQFFCKTEVDIGYSSNLFLLIRVLFHLSCCGKHPPGHCWCCHQWSYHHVRVDPTHCQTLSLSNDLLNVTKFVALINLCKQLTLWSEELWHNKNIWWQNKNGVWLLVIFLYQGTWICSRFHKTCIFNYIILYKHSLMMLLNMSIILVVLSF